MADAPVVHIGENSPEKIAYELLVSIAQGEGKRLRNAVGGGSKADVDRQWLLDTYAECLRTVRDPDGRLRGTHEQALDKLK